MREDDTIRWQTIRHDLPSLIDVLEQALNKEGGIDGPDHH
jgi:hypothetical protein